jgi:hypothetical protein
MANAQLLKPESFVLSFLLKKKQNKSTADRENPSGFQSICDFSGIVYRTEPEKIFPANKPEFSL